MPCRLIFNFFSYYFSESTVQNPLPHRPAKLTQSTAKDLAGEAARCHKFRQGRKYHGAGPAINILLREASTIGSRNNSVARLLEQLNDRKPTSTLVIMSRQVGNLEKNVYGVLKRSSIRLGLHWELTTLPRISISPGFLSAMLFQL